MPTPVFIALILLLPGATMWASRHSHVLELLSPVVLCYILGMLLGNQNWFALDVKLTQQLAGFAVLLAISLLLLSADLSSWRRLAPRMLKAMGLALLSVIIVSFIAALIFAPRVQNSWQIAGMLVGVYTGGTANMAAIATALSVKPERFVLLHSSDVLIGGLYLLFLLSLGARFFFRFLKVEQSENYKLNQELISDNGKAQYLFKAGLALGLALLVIALSFALSRLVPKGAAEAVAILSVTSLALLLSFIPKVRALEPSEDLGQYALLVFSVAIGSMARFERMLHMPLAIFAYTATVVLGAIFLHMLLCMLARIDRDSCVITSTAAIYGPAFVPPVAMAFNNRQIVLAGISSGLVGIAAGNYLGLLVAYGLRSLMQ